MRHVTDSRTGDAALDRAGLATKDEHFATVETPPSDDATQQGRLTASAGTQQSVSVDEVKINRTKGLLTANSRGYETTRNYLHASFLDRHVEPFKDGGTTLANTVALDCVTYDDTVNIVCRTIRLAISDGWRLVFTFRHSFAFKEKAVNVFN